MQPRQKLGDDGVGFDSVRSAPIHQAAANARGNFHLVMKEQFRHVAGQLVTPRSWFLAVMHVAVFTVAYWLAYMLRFDFNMSPADEGLFASSLLWVVGLKLLVFCLLAQFRYDFAENTDARQLIGWIHEQFAEFAPLVTEVRHKSWESSPSLSFFRDLGIAVANLDYPVGRDSFDLYRCITAPVSYLRLHGRNGQAWFRKCESASEPYNYDYSDEEVSSLTRRVQELAGSVQQLTIVANNHYRGKAVSAALRLKAAIERRDVPVPPALLETFPGLQRIAVPD